MYRVRVFVCDWFGRARVCVCMYVEVPRRVRINRFFFFVRVVTRLTSRGNNNLPVHTGVSAINHHITNSYIIASYIHNYYMIASFCILVAPVHDVLR